MSEDQREIVMVHVSDPQFGQYHRFTDGHDSLASRLLQDLGSVLPEIGAVDLLIVSGDVAEQGKRSEFDTARSFLEQMASTLQLDMTRIVVVPGNHDVNWALCRSYFADCEAREIDPTVPYEPKYEFFLDFVESIEGTRPVSTFGVRHFPEMDLSIAALDSTRKESHDDHFGFCGEDQLRKIAAELGADGLGRRVAVLHHNVRRKAIADNENLIDEDAFSSILGPHLDLVLHGHTHDGKRDYLSSGELVLSTGSAAITKDWRPLDAGNQYQILKWSSTSILRRARQYMVDRWVPDGRVGDEASPGREVIDLRPKFMVDISRELFAPSKEEPQPPSASVDILASIAEQQEIDHDVYREFKDALRAGAVPSSGRGLQPLELLARLGLVREGKLTVAAVMLVGPNPQGELPQTDVKCVRYFGVDKTAERESEVMQGTVWRQVDDAYDFLLTRMSRRETTSGEQVRSEITYRYPTKCLREVVVNAIVHRDYSDEERSTHIRLFDDRIEIWSPGSWLGQDLSTADTSLRSLSGESVRRNPVLARALASIRYFEGEGSGLPVALSDSIAAGAPEPTARSEGGFVVVTVRPSEFDPEIVARAATLARAQSEFAIPPGTDVEDFSALAKTPRLRGTGHEGSTRISLGQFKSSEDRASIIVGPPGSGKTTIMSGLLSLAGLSSELPILIRGSTAHIGPAVMNLPSAVCELWSTSGLQVTNAQVDAILKEHRCWVMIDEFELLDSWSENFLEMLCASLASYPLLRITIAMRPTGFRFVASSSCSWSRYEVLPFTQAQFERMIRDRGSDLDIKPSIKDILTYVRQLLKFHPRLRQLTQVPLTAKLVADATLRTFPLSAGYLEIMDQTLHLLESLDARRGSKQVGLLSSLGERRMLEILALEAMVQRRNWRSMSESWLVGEMSKFVLDEDSARSTLRALASRGVLLTFSAKSERLAPKYEFSSKLIFEYLAASGAVGRWVGDPSMLADLLIRYGMPGEVEIVELSLLKVERIDSSMAVGLTSALLSSTADLPRRAGDDELRFVLLKAASQMSRDTARSIAAMSVASIDVGRNDETARALREHADELMSGVLEQQDRQRPLGI